MANDIFGYNKDAVSSVGLIPPGAVTLTINGKINLAQSVEINYQREITPVYELGSENVYLVAGKSSGTLNVARMIGEALVQFKPSSPCATENITITKGDSTCGTGNLQLSMTGMIRSVRFSAQAGQVTVTDGADYLLSSLSVN